jgi:acyl carrier protein
LDRSQTFGAKSKEAADSVNSLLLASKKTPFQDAVDKAATFQPRVPEHPATKNPNATYGKPTIYASNAKECMYPSEDLTATGSRKLAATSPGFALHEPGQHRERGYNDKFNPDEAFGYEKLPEGSKSIAGKNAASCMSWEIPPAAEKKRNSVIDLVKDKSFGRTTVADAFNVASLLSTCGETLYAEKQKELENEFGAEDEDGNNDLTGHDPIVITESKLFVPPKGFGVATKFNETAADLLQPTAFTLRGLKPEEAIQERANRILEGCGVAATSDNLQVHISEGNLGEDKAAFEELIARLSSEFGIAIPSHILHRCKTLQELITWISDNRRFATKK